MRYPEIILLEEKQALLASIVDSSEDAIISKTLQGIITSWNPAAERMFGYKEAEIIGQHISCIIPVDRLHEEEFIIGEVSNGRRIEHFETIRKSKSGNEIALSLSISPVKNKDGQIIGASKIARDISVYKKTAEKQDRLAAIVNNSDDAIISKTLNGIITSWNKAAERLFGFSEADALNRHISLIIPEDRLAEEEYIINEISMGNSVAHFETIRMTKDGLRIPISLTISPIISQDGKIIGASKIARDISEKIAIQEEKERLYNEVKLLSEKKDEFIAMTTHELKTPITSLSGFLQLLEMYYSSDTKNASIVRRCIKQTDKLSLLINDLLEFSKMRAGKLRLRYETFDMVQLVTEVLEAYKESECHHFVVNTKGQILIHADPLRIEQVVVNLVINAIKYSPAGGNIEISIWEKEGNVFASVKDYGIGISQELIDNLFSQFYRAVEPNYNIPGLGMGLYISKQIIERHNGTINVKSEISKGSTFEFMLPVSKVEEI
ncbi:PAS domain S-box protein [Niabella ginsengisoli]|uniref:histidine kinase n=1 Tax=Niabella ginsengisoli TaxID=522298 RepID=A0ABS9SGN4_9BACT|nr:PAS domain S-box protein [Niabella ginsengisoli]MCH5597528.1 PAS domain S-box protein [Niabella ginsengisoli]